ncbi:hypothetical protein B0H14DRAFT_2654035 [Mycena olivaceomarginata]|nr:hypothetical protein B0H14DRAFT_2654035 [Mycena olivaceomarginata]
MFHPSLHTKRLKQTIIRDEKLKVSPEGLGVAGVYARHVRDLKLPAEQRYIQSIVTTPGGKILIITMVPYLATLVHVAGTVQVDTTFGRTAGDLNEWEFVIWYGSVERVLTVGRVYTDGMDRSHYKCLFDELQKIIFSLTGKHLRFKRFTRGGNFITMGVDLEAAQVQGASDSFLPTNEPEYSGIMNTTDGRESSHIICVVTVWWSNHSYTEPRTSQRYGTGCDVRPRSISVMSARWVPLHDVSNDDDQPINSCLLYFTLIRKLPELESFASDTIRISGHFLICFCRSAVGFPVNAAAAPPTPPIKSEVILLRDSTQLPHVLSADFNPPPVLSSCLAQTI